jgi:hypothetical protein
VSSTPSPSSIVCWFGDTSSKFKVFEKPRPVFQRKLITGFSGVVCPRHICSVISMLRAFPNSFRARLKRGQVVRQCSLLASVLHCSHCEDDLYGPLSIGFLL